MSLIRWCFFSGPPLKQCLVGLAADSFYGGLAQRVPATGLAILASSLHTLRFILSYWKFRLHFAYDFIDHTAVLFSQFFFRPRARSVRAVQEAGVVELASKLFLLHFFPFVMSALYE